MFIIISKLKINTSKHKIVQVNLSLSQSLITMFEYELIEDPKVIQM